MSKPVNALQERIQIQDNKFIPAFLLGTKLDEQSFSLALSLGFFAFDMAAVYKTEDILLNAISTFITDNNLVNSRSKFYFCYKLDALRLLPDQVNEQVEILLSKIKRVFPECDAYIDMLAIHSPNHNVSIEQTWDSMNALVQCGKILSIGVSNFNVYHLECMEKMQLSTPAINQIEINPFFSQLELAEYCRDRKIIVSSYRSARNKATSQDLELLSKIAAELNMTPIQIINSWKFTNGFQILALSRNHAHLEELKLVKWLEPIYMQQLDGLDKNELGRTCVGTWSCFDFRGSKWDEYVMQQNLVTTT